MLSSVLITGVTPQRDWAAIALTGRAWARRPALRPHSAPQWQEIDGTGNPWSGQAEKQTWWLENTPKDKWIYLRTSFPTPTSHFPNLKNNINWIITNKVINNKDFTKQLGQDCLFLPSSNEWNAWKKSNTRTQKCVTGEYCTWGQRKILTDCCLTFNISGGIHLWEIYMKWRRKNMFSYFSEL